MAVEPSRAAGTEPTPDRMEVPDAEPADRRVLLGGLDVRSIVVDQSSTLLEPAVLGAGMPSWQANRRDENIWMRSDPPLGVMDIAAGSGTMRRVMLVTRAR